MRQLKESVSIIEVVGELVRLRKQGTNYMGLCPFHNERSPSFSVSEKKGLYHCFGCNRNGDVITFVQELHSLSFPEAVRDLAARYGMKIPPELRRGGARDGESSGAESRKDPLVDLYRLNRFVAQFYHERLLGPGGEAARKYLVERGVSEATIRGASLGYAPAGWSELYDFLVSRKAPLESAEKLGLIRRKEKARDSTGRAHYDLFRDRVIFPVADTRGHVIAFGGRRLGEGDGPKYLNSTDSPVYRKGSHLYGLFRAQKEIRAEDLCVVVEGFMDCLSMQQAGIGYAVATLGTALTERQVAVLKRLTGNIVVLFDGDAAGQEAQARAMETFLNEGVVARGIALPDGLDPDEFVRERGADALAEMIRNAPFLLDQKILELASKAGAHAEERARAMEIALPWVAKLPSDTARLVRIEDLSGLFGAPAEVLERRVAELQRSGQRGSGKSAGKTWPLPRGRAAQAMGQKMSIDALDASMIESLILHPELVSALDEDRREAMLSGMESSAARGLAEKLLEKKKPSAADALEFTQEPALRAILTRALVVSDGAVGSKERGEETARAVSDLAAKLVRRGWERRLETLRAEILKEDGSGRSDEVSKRMSEYHRLAKKLDETKGGQAIP